MRVYLWGITKLRLNSARFINTTGIHALYFHLKVRDRYRLIGPR